MLTVLMLLITVMPAWAASRVVISTPEPMQVFVDGMLEPTSIGSVRVAVPHIKPGEHTIAVHSLSGHLLHTETVVVPENADVRVTYIPGMPFQVTGAAPSLGPAPDNAAVASQVSSAPGTVQPGPVSASQGGASGGFQPSTSEVLSGTAASTSRASGLANVMKNPSPTNLVVGTGRGLKSMTAGARAGTNFGAAPPASRKIKKANVVYGRATFQKASGGPVVIYESGHLVAQLGAGEASVTVDLEVGRRELEIRSGLDYSVLFQGDLQVDRHHVEQVMVSDAAPPRATLRPWLWKDL